jgi:hypothetical protein
MEKELIKIIKTLNKHKIQYMLIGGYAVILYGVKRSTFDIDIAIGLSHDNIVKTSFLIHKIGFVQIHPENSGINPNYGIRFTNGKVDLDLMFIENPIFDNLYRYHESLQYGGTTIKMPNIMDLVSLKESSMREKDIHDAIELRNIATLKMRKK